MSGFQPFKVLQDSKLLLPHEKESSIGRKLCSIFAYESRKLLICWSNITSRIDLWRSFKRIREILPLIPL
jgi:hypothetical protein